MRLIDQVVEMFGYHRKAALRVLRKRAEPEKREPVVRTGRPRQYEGRALEKPLKAIWLASGQPCGKRLVGMLAEWVPAYEADHQVLAAEVKAALLQASARTLDRLLQPWRGGAQRQGGTRPGSLLKQSIPLRGPWTEEGPGWVEMDTVALCGRRLDDLHAWMLDVVDIRTDWVELRGLANRSQHSTLEQVRDIEASLPFQLRGADSDNGGEFINHHLVRYFRERPEPVCFTRSRPYHKNDNAHVEQRNWTHVRQHFGYERYDNPEVIPLLNALCKGALGLFLNHFLCAQKLVGKERHAGKVRRRYGPAQSAYQRVLAAPEVAPDIKARLEVEHRELNPFQLARDIERQKRLIESCRLRP